MTETGSQPPQSRKRRTVAIAVGTIIAATYMAVAWHVDQRAQPCWTVHRLIDFNDSAQASLKAKTHFAAAGSYEEDRLPTDADYQAWIDGMQRYADRVTAPGVSEHAHKAAALAAQLPAIRARFAAQTAQQKPGDPTGNVPAAREFAELNRNFNEEFAALKQACPNA